MAKELRRCVKSGTLRWEVSLEQPCGSIVVTWVLKNSRPFPAADNQEGDGVRRTWLTLGGFENREP